MRVAIYSKSIPGKTAAAQERDLRRLCQERGWTVSKVFLDPPGRSQKLSSGKGRLALLDALLGRRNKFGAVLVWRVALLGVCIDDLLWLLNEVHVKRGVHIVAVADRIDMTKDDSLKKVLMALAKI